MMTSLYYIHDPMCSWCWAFRPAWEKIKTSVLSSYTDCSVEYVLGGLAPDSDQPMDCLLYTSPSPRDRTRSRMPSSA